MSPPPPSGGLPGDPDRAARPGRRSGIALVIVLGFLTILTILAIGFSVQMRTERLAAGLYLHSARDGHLIHVAAARAVGAIEEDLGWHFETRGGIQRYLDTPMAPAWRDGVNGPVVNVLSSTGTARRVDLGAGGALEHLPDLNAADRAAVAAAEWLPVVVDGQAIGRIAYSIVDCGGLLDITAVGQGPRQPFDKDSRRIAISPELLGEFPGAASVASFRGALSNEWGRIESFPEFRRALDAAGAVRPYSNVFFYSHFPQGEFYDQYHQVVRNRTEVGTNLASVLSNEAAFMEEWTRIHEITNQSDPRYWELDAERVLGYTAEIFPGTESAHNLFTQDNFKALFSGLIDYLDEDAIPQSPRSINWETTPKISEVIFSNTLQSVEIAPPSGHWTNSLSIYVEISFPHPVSDVARDYDLEIELRTLPAGSGLSLGGVRRLELNAAGPRDPGYPPSATWLPNEYRTWVNRFDFQFAGALPTIPARPRYELQVRIFERASGELVDVADNLTIDTNQIFQPPVNALVLPMNVSSADNQGGLRGLGLRSQTLNPFFSPELLNWSHSDYEAFAATPNAPNLPRRLLAYSRSQDRLDDLSELWRVPMRRGTAVPLLPIGSAGSAYRTYNEWNVRRDPQFYDRFALSTNLPSRGYINTNTRNTNVLAHAFLDVDLHWFAGIPGLFRGTGGSSNLFAFTPHTLTVPRARGFAGKMVIDRDVVFPYWTGHSAYDPTFRWKNRTTFQHLGWGDMMVMSFMKYHYFYGRTTPVNHNAEEFRTFPQHPPARSGLPSHWVSAGWYQDGNISQMDFNGIRHTQFISNAQTGSERMRWKHFSRNHYMGFLHPRQNLFTILLAAQAIAPQPAAAPVPDSSVLSERRAVMVLWRDPWPTAPEGETDHEDFDKARRVHKAQVLSFQWLDE